MRRHIPEQAKPSRRMARLWQHRIRPGLVGIGAAWIFSAPAYANPQGGVVVGGQAAISAPDAKTVLVEQSSQRAIINWQRFDVAADELTRFEQPSAGAIALNRVQGGDLSTIYGRLEANGRLVLINPNGVVFGGTAEISTGGLVATTHDIDNARFMAGQYVFDRPGAADGAIVNEGAITAADAGLVAFVAPSVRNAGTIAARLGTIEMAGANGFTLDFHGDRLISFPVDAELLVAPGGAGALVENHGALLAEGGTIILSARAARGIVENVINTDGIIRAASATQQGGRIVLDGGAAGTVVAAGVLDASGISGGEVELKGESVYADGVLTARGTAVTGGRIGVEAGHIVSVAGLLDAQGAEHGGSVAIDAPAVILTGAIDVRGADGGDVAIGSIDTLNSGLIDASGTANKGGSVVMQASNRHVATEGSTVTVDGKFEGGRIEVGGKAVGIGSVFTSANYSAQSAAGAGGTIRGIGKELWFIESEIDTSGFMKGGQIEIGGQSASIYNTVARVNGAIAGAIDIWSKEIGILGSTLEAIGDELGGLIRVGGSFQGGKQSAQKSDISWRFQERFSPRSNLPDADFVYIDAASKVTAHGGLEGGTVIVWSQLGTWVLGQVNATGGHNGGAVELSSQGALYMSTPRNVDLGQGGILLLDPKNIVVDTVTYAPNSIVNGGFETGSFSGWTVGITPTVAEGALPYYLNTLGNGWVVSNAPTGSFNRQPIEGFSAFNGFDGGMSGHFSGQLLSPALQFYLSQTVTVFGPVSGAQLQFQFDIQGGPNCCGYLASPIGDRVFDVRLTAVESNSLVATPFRYVVPAGFTDSLPMQTVSVDISDVLNQAGPGIYKIEFIEVIPQHFTGAGSFVIDNIALSLSSGLVTGNLFDQAQSKSSHVAAADIVSMLASGTSVLLQASNDLTVDAAILVDNLLGNGGALTLQAGRSILVNADIATDNGNLTLIGNEQLAAGVVDGDRDAGAATIVMANGTSIDAGTGAVSIWLRDGEGKTHQGSGEIVLGAITAGTILVVNEGPDGGHIVLNDVLTASAAGNSLVLAAASGGNFVNNHGVGALDPGAGRFLVYAADPSLNTNGGIAANPVYNRNWADNAPASIAQTGNRFLYSIAPVLTVTADDKTREYGLANPTLTASITGFINGDDEEDAVSGSAGLTTAALMGSNVGDYDIDGTIGTLVSDFGYGFDFVSGTLSVTPASLTVTADDQSREYGLANPALTGVITGFRNSDDESVVTGLSYQTAADIGSNVGDYAITSTGGTATNYIVTTRNDGTLSVTPAGLTVQANDASRRHGEANPVFTAEILGLRNGDGASVLSGLVLSSLAGTNSPVGAYAITSAGGTAVNYIITQRIDGTLTVEPVPSNSVLQQFVNFVPGEQYAGTNDNPPADIPAGSSSSFSNLDITGSIGDGNTGEGAQDWLCTLGITDAAACN